MAAGIHLARCGAWAVALTLGWSVGAGALADPVLQTIDRAVASPAGPLSLKALGGGQRTLETGKVHIVHFFATWCESCRPELDSLDRLQRDHGSDRLAVVAVSVAEPEQRLRRYFAERPVLFPVLMDQDRSASRAWKIEVLPSTVVVDGEGRSRLLVQGALDWQGPDVRSTLDRLTSETKSSEQRTTPGRPE